MSRWVLDASALLALINQEAGGQRTRAVLRQGAVISAVNLAEVVTRLSDLGMSPESVQQTMDCLEFEVVDFETDAAYETGFLRQATKAAGLSLGDRACLALARRLRLPVLAADRALARPSVGIKIELLR